MPTGDQSGLRQGVSKGLSLAIPLVIQKRRLEASENQFNQQMTMKKLQLINDGLQARDKIQADFAIKAFMKSIETGDDELARGVMPDLAKHGINTESLQNISPKGKIPTTLEGLYTKGLVEDQPNEQAFKKMMILKQAGRKLDKPGLPRFYQHRDDPNKIVTIQGNKMPPDGFVPYAKPGRGKDKTISPTELRQRAKDVASAEKAIIDDGDVTQIGIFNRYAKRPYVFLGTQGKKMSFLGFDELWPDVESVIDTIELPKYNGRQVYAEDVYHTAVENDMTFEEVLREIGAME